MEKGIKNDSVFVSSSASDYHRVLPIVSEIKKQGWRVFWESGEQESRQVGEETERAVTEASCVVVFWSSSSVQSFQVKYVAALAMNRSILLPVLLEQIDIPAPFSHTQTLDLISEDLRKRSGSNLILEAAQAILTSSITSSHISPDTMAAVIRELGHRIMIVEDDCQSLRGRFFHLSNYRLNLKSLVGLVAAEDICELETDKVIIAFGEPIRPHMVELLEEHRDQMIMVRSRLTCQSELGKCAKCFGWVPGTEEFPELGARVGIDCAESLVEVGMTQRVVDVLMARVTDSAILSEIDGRAEISNTGVLVQGNEKTWKKHYVIPQDQELATYEGASILAGDKLTYGEASPHDMMDIMGVAEAQEFLLDNLRNTIGRRDFSRIERAAEIFVDLMTCWVRILEPADSPYRKGEIVFSPSLSACFGRMGKTNRGFNNERSDDNRLIAPISKPIVLDLLSVLQADFGESL